MPKITRIAAREILDSRAIPTIEVSLLTDAGSYSVASVPSGVSMSQNEDVELRDGDLDRYHGKGVLKAIDHIHKTLAPALIGRDVTAQEKLDAVMLELDGTPNQSKLGANSILAISIAAIKAAASCYNLPLFMYLQKRYRPGSNLRVPTPIFNLINGGAHGAGNLDFQEFHVIPSSRMPYKEALRAGAEIWMSLRDELIHRNAIHSVGDEGGFAPNLFTNADALELMSLVIKNSPYRLGLDVYLGLDVAANGFHKSGVYHIKDSPKPLDRTGMIQLYQALVKDYGLLGLEDPLDHDDWKGWSELTQVIPESTMVIGDDLITTNAARLKQAIEQKACSAVIVKPNQIGTITETIALLKVAQDNNITTISSHRSGETNDTFIADFAVGLGTTYAKFGAPDRGERVAKYNRLLEIDAFLNSQKQ